MIPIEDVLLQMVAQKGDRYIFGAEAKASDPNPSAFDCSELVEWACSRANVLPKMPDGADNQRRHCEQAGTMITVDQGMRTRGALLFVGDNTGSGRDRTTHVAGSLGDGTTIEARGSKWGVGTWPSAKRFDFAALIPGCDYTPGQKRFPPNVPQEDDMPKVQQLDATCEVGGTTYKKGDVFVIAPAWWHYVKPDELNEVERQWGAHTPINAVAFGMSIAGAKRV